MLTFEEAGERKLGKVRDRDEAEQTLNARLIQGKGYRVSVSCRPIMVENLTPRYELTKFSLGNNLEQFFSSQISTI